MHRVASTVDTLGRKPSLSRVRAFCEAILEAAGHPSPWESDAGARAFSVFAEDYLARQKSKGKVSALAPAVFRDFSEFAGKPALSACTPEVLQRFHDHLVGQKLASGSIANKLGCLSGLFGHAVSLGLVPANPVAVVESGDSVSVMEREAFPDDVLARFMGWLLDSPEPDAGAWFNACMLGRYAGMALIDAANACPSWFFWVLSQPYLRYQRHKTRKYAPAIIQPIFSPLSEWLEEGDLPRPLCGELAGKPTTVLSTRFCELLEKAGCAGPVVVTPSGREMRTRTFHSLRAAYVTWLVNLGVPEELRMKLCGHARKDVHRGYNKAKVGDIAAQLAPYFKKVTAA